MDYIEGEALNTAWAYNLSLEEKKQVIAQLAGFVKQLQDLQPPHPELVASAKGGGVVDGRIGHQSARPYKTHEEFHEYLRGGISLENCTKTYGPAVTSCHSRKYQTRFCHADLAPRNIIVQGGQIAAIIDWQFGGWYPEYWESTKAYYPLYPATDWHELLQEVVGNYDEELKAERILWKLFDQPGLNTEWFAAPADQCKP